MFSDQPSPGPYRGPQIAAVEVHGVASDLSLAQLRTLFGRVAPVLQTVAALDGSDSGVALVIFGSQQACDGAVELFDGFPLGKAFLHVKRAENLPNSLINLLYSLVQPTAAEAAAAQQQQKQDQEKAAAAASSAAAAAFLGQQLQQHQQKQQQQEEEERQAWQDVAEAQLRSDAAAAAADAWGAALARSQSQQLGNGLSANGHPPANGSAAAAAAASQALAVQQQQQQQQLELEQLGADLRQMQLDQQQRQQAAAAAVAAAQQQQQQQQQAPPMSWASAAAAVPRSAAAALAAGGGGPGSDEWQTAGASRGRHGRRADGGDSASASASAGQGPSSVSSGSPRPIARSNGRRSDDKVARPGGQDGASAEPTTKLWMGGVDGAASAETVRAVFGRFGPIFDYELQPATHEKGRTDQWGFVNFKRLSDAARAYETLVGEVIPELTGTRKLKLQFRPVDVRRGGAARR